MTITKYQQGVCAYGKLPCFLLLPDHLRWTQWSQLCKVCFEFARGDIYIVFFYKNHLTLKAEDDQVYHWQVFETRLMEIRVVIHESFKIIALNILFRFFFIVHAEKGLLVRCFYLWALLSFSFASFPFVIFFKQLLWYKVGGHLNTSLFNKIYVLLFLGTTSAQAWSKSY